MQALSSENVSVLAMEFLSKACSTSVNSSQFCEFFFFYREESWSLVRVFQYSGLEAGGS